MKVFPVGILFLQRAWRSSLSGFCSCSVHGGIPGWDFVVAALQGRFPGWDFAPAAVHGGFQAVCCVVAVLRDDFLSHWLFKKIVGSINSGGKCKNYFKKKCFF